MTLTEYINALQKWAKEHPEEANTLTVVMTQGGYYSDGPFADLYDFPCIESVSFGYDEKIPDDERDETTPYWRTHRRKYDKRAFIVLGNSYQSY